MSASWSLATVWCATWVKVAPRTSVTATVAPRSAKTPTMTRSPEVTLPANAPLAVWPLGWAFDTLCTNVMPVEESEAMVTVRVALPVPLALLALSVTVEVPAAVGVPEIRPVAELTDKPAGNPVAP